MKVVLTAGHCLKNANGGVIIIGTNDLLSNETDVVRHYVDSSSFKVHPQFNIHVAYLDVALIILPEPLKFSNAIQSVKLPSGYLLDESFAGEIGTVSGYGQYCDTCGSSNLLRFTQNRVMQNKECGKSFEIGLIPSENHVCLSTVETNSGNCRGDSETK
ncbi:CLUMA_CG003670, isoform A [Clunio marinus]|nr:CLUMA_CG003670, isoform A [Clunio marinus]